MVTASHNPPAGQRLQGLPRRRQPDRAARRRRDLRRDRGGRPARRRAPRRRLAACSATTSSTPTSTTVAGARRPDGPRDLRVVYTPLHGVGGATVLAGDAPRRLRRRRTSCPRRPSPTRTSRPSPFPNPEEPGAMDLAMALAAEVGRRPRASPTTRTPTGAPSRSPGRTAGGCCAATRSGRCSATSCSARARGASTPTSIVSSSLLGRWPRRAGQPYVETLTGFKWIGRRRGAGVRLRGGAGLLRRPRASSGQGRRLGAAAARASSRRC